LRLPGLDAMETEDSSSAYVSSSFWSALLARPPSPLPARTMISY